MHEMSIAVALMDQVIDVAQANNMSHVDEVVIETGFLRQVIPEMMQEAYQSVIQGTLAEGSTLKIQEISAKVKCTQCQKVFAPQIDNFLCPDCQKADFQVLQGDDIVLKSVACY